MILHTLKHLNSFIHLNSSNHLNICKTGTNEETTDETVSTLSRVLDTLKKIDVEKKNNKNMRAREQLQPNKD